MLTEPTMQKLAALSLDGMVATWSEQQKNPAATSGLSFDERLALLVDAEWSLRLNSASNAPCARPLSRSDMPASRTSTTRPSASSTRS